MSATVHQCTVREGVDAQVRGNLMQLRRTIQHIVETLVSLVGESARTPSVDVLYLCHLRPPTD